MTSQSTNMSHAIGDSKVPNKLQEKLPEGVERAVPNVIHDTGDNKASSHATDRSFVPQVAQEAVPQKLEEVLPETIHPTK